MAASAASSRSCSAWLPFSGSRKGAHGEEQAPRIGVSRKPGLQGELHEERLVLAVPGDSDEKVTLIDDAMVRKLQLHFERMQARHEVPQAPERK
jgi:hypothetical protein